MSLWNRIERRITDLAGEILPDEFREQVAEARRLLEDGNSEAAAESLEALVSERPNHAAALSLLGAARLELGQAEPARLNFERALATDPDLADAHLGRGEASAVLGDSETAIDAFRTAVAAAGGDRAVLHESYRGLGQAYRQNGALEKAIRELRKAVAEAPADGISLGALGEALLASGALDPAERYLKRAAEAEIQTVATWLGLGGLSLAVANPDPAEARVRFERALELATTNRADQTHDAGPGYERSREFELRALMGIGDAALAAGQPTEANQFYLQALELSPRRADVHRRIGDVHRRIGSGDAALAAYDRALELCAATASGVGDSAEASEAFVRATLETALDTALENDAVVPAVRLANELLQRNPNHVRALVARGIALAEDANPDAARATFRAALVGGGDLEAHLALARLELKASQNRDADEANASSASALAGTSAAASEALAALRIDPDSARARSLLAEARQYEFAPNQAIQAPASATAGADVELYRLLNAVRQLAQRNQELAELGPDAARAAADFDQPLLVTVMGEFSSGKSSFVNAFIGTEVAPMGITPTTATINVVKYGRERGGRVLYRDGRAENLTWPALLERLRNLDETRAVDIRHVEILVPLPELERVNIVDTPGLNSILPEHERVARDFIARADAVVWLFTANQAGKKSEREALAEIRREGVRVMGVLNKVDQLSKTDVDQVMAYVRSELGDKPDSKTDEARNLVEIIVPFSARDAMKWRATAGDAKNEAGTEETGNWPELEREIEERFFARAREIKRAATDRRLAALLGRARASSELRRERTVETRDMLQGAARNAHDAADAFAENVAAAGRRTLVTMTAELYRRAAREVLELVQPRRLPFGSHTATVADRDYLISLLLSGYEAALERVHLRVLAELRSSAAAATSALSDSTPILGADAVSDIARTADDAIRLVEARVFARCRAYLAGYLQGGYVDAFFRVALPKLELTEDAVYHALFRDSPDLDEQIGAPLAEAGRSALSAMAGRIDHWSGVADILAFDIEIGLHRALDRLDARRLELKRQDFVPTESTTDG